ncbi:hemin ABC transporter substrate-binding protein [Comamonas endophytica]|uniref:heme/hemin ABC transporter substrate-binding protein n=1 Tax=Comamonas endophytica TaxID=2949090 RepID=UPI003614DC57
MSFAPRCSCFFAAPLAQAAAPARVVGLGGPVTEIIYALGAGERLVGADASSIYPAEAHRLPKVGYYRSFSIEGVASLKPDLVLASEDSGPLHALEQLRRLGSLVVILPSAPTLEALDQRIMGVAKALDIEPRGAALVQKLHADLRAVRPSPAKPRVLLISSHTGRLQGAGDDTAAAAMLKLMDARNVLAGQRGYKPLSAEAAVALRPEVIVTGRMSVDASGGLDAFLAQPGLAATPAARSRRVVVMDDLLLLGFGPRLPEALRLLDAGFSTQAVAR